MAIPLEDSYSGNVETEVNPGAIQALKDMGARLQTLERFHISTDLTGEVVLADGQKLQHTATAEMDVQRPAKLRARMFSARAERIESRRRSASRGRWDYDHYHPVATAAAVTAGVAVTAAVVGSMVNTIPASCVPVNYGGLIYQRRSRRC